MQNSANKRISKLTKAESDTLVKLAQQLELEDRGNIPLEEVAARTKIPLERLQTLIERGQFVSAYLSNEGPAEQWYVSMSEWNLPNDNPLAIFGKLPDDLPP